MSLLNRAYTRRSDSTVDPALTKITDDPYTFGMPQGRMAAVKRDIANGAEKFWAKRGLKVPDGDWRGAGGRHVGKGEE